MKKNDLISIVFILVLSLGSTIGNAQKATPDAVGFGAKARGAYAGSSSPRILVVDDLSDASTGNESTGRGTFRWAVTRTYPRIVIFEVSGYISLKSPLKITSPYITIAGQTAPNPGITVRHYDVYFEASEVIVQHLRFRLSDEAFDGKVEYNSARDAADVFKGPNVFIDHCSFSWSIDELFSMQDSNNGTVRNVTVSNCIMSEALANSLHPKGEHGYGQIISSGVDSLSIIGNLYAHMRQRAPELAGVRNVVIQNNLIYNTRHNNITIRDSYSDNLYANASDVRVVIMGNKLISGANTLKDMVITIEPNVPDNAGIYIEDNTAPATDGWYTNDPLKGNGPWTVVDTKDSTRFNSARPLIKEPYAKLYPSKNLEDYVLPNAGARPKDRDAIDKRVVNDVKNGTGSFIDSQSEVGGFPVLAQNKVSHDLPASPHGQGSMAGYTNLEVWLYNKHLELTSGDKIEIDQSVQIYDQDFSVSYSTSNIGQLTTYNPSGSKIDYKIVEGDDQNLFSISPSGLLVVNNNSEIKPGSTFFLVVSATTTNSTDRAEINISFLVPENTININIGSSSFSHEWNDLLPGVNRLENINYSDGISSDISFNIWSDWKASNGGDVSGTCYLDEVIRSYVFTSDNTVRYFSLDGLDNNKTYTLEILSSRSSEAPGNRGAFYVIGNLEKEIDAKGNTCNLVSFENVKPTDGQIKIGYRKRIADSDGHVNAFIITENASTGETPDTTKSGEVVGGDEKLEDNTLPIIVLDYEESVNSGTVNHLIGTNSFDPDGESLSYRWIVPEGVSVSKSNESELTYLAPEVSTPTIKSFVIEVSDGIDTSYKSIEITFTPYKPEIRKVQVVSIKASHYEGDNHPINLLDGDPSTYWSAKGDNQWVSMELTSPVDISHLKLAFHGMDEKRSQYDILLSQDNTNWESLYEHLNSCGFSSATHLVDCASTKKSSASYKYVKILGHGTNVDDLNSISEFEVFGENSATTSVNSNIEEQFKVYPNPASQYFTVDLNENGVVSLFDISGKNIFQKYFEKGEHRLDVDFPSGCYIISVVSDNHTNIKQKLIVE